MDLLRCEIVLVDQIFQSWRLRFIWLIFSLTGSYNHSPLIVWVSQKMQHNNLNPLQSFWLVFYLFLGLCPVKSTKITLSVKAIICL